MISIITASLNRIQYVTKAIESVLHQENCDVEHIIIDGGSTDGTLDLLAGYQHLRVFNDPDQGMYEALNKGLHAAEGDLVGLLNSDDFYEPNVFDSIRALFASHPELDAVIGGARIFQEVNGRAETLAVHPASVDEIAERLTLGVPAINAWFFRKRVFEKLGGFDSLYRIAADREFLIRFYLSGVRIGAYEGIVYHYRQHSDSLTFNEDIAQRRRFKLEDLQIAEVYARHAILQRECREWHLRLTLNMAADAIRQRDLPFALSTAWRGWRMDGRWPLHLLKNAFRGLGRSLQRAVSGQ